MRLHGKAHLPSMPPIAPSQRRQARVIIYDYVDMRVPVLARMAAKRRIGYQSIGYKILGTRDLFSGQVVTSSALATR